MEAFDYLTFENSPTTEDRLLFLESFVFNAGFRNPDIREAIKAFYSQPFKQSLIASYFEGFTTDEYGQIFRSQDVNIHFTEGFPDGYWIIKQDDNAKEFPRPEFLNDFIRDCRRLKIKLHFINSNWDLL